MYAENRGVASDDRETTALAHCNAPCRCLIRRSVDLGVAGLSSFIGLVDWRLAHVDHDDALPLLDGQRCLAQRPAPARRQKSRARRESDAAMLVAHAMGGAAAHVGPLVLALIGVVTVVRARW